LIVPKNSRKSLSDPSDISNNNYDDHEALGGNSINNSGNGIGNSNSQADRGSTRGEIPNNSDDPAPSNYPSQNEKYSPYTFNGKIVIGIAIILAVSAASAIAASSVSTSPVIRLTSINTFSPSGSTPQAAAQEGQKNPQQVSANKHHIDKQFVLVAHEFGFNASNGGPTIQVAKGDTVQITFINAGHMAHNFGMAKLSDETSKIINKTKEIPIDQRVSNIPYDVMAAMPCPGCQEKFDEGHIENFILPDQQQITTFTADESGHFKYFCQVRGHIWMGMMGDLIVTEKPSGLTKGGLTT
jgi:plastocyanin